MQITIGIASFNEERNIAKLLDLIIRQKGNEKIEISQIIVSDDSNDRTPEIVQRYVEKNARVQLHHYSQRRGKPCAVNEIFEKATGEIIVLFDADTIPASESVVLRLVEPMLSDPSIGIVGGAPIAAKPRTLMERIAYFTFEIWSHLRENINKGSNFFAIHGKIMAVSPNIFRRVVIPQQVIGDDAYLYLMCVKLGYKAVYAKKAMVYYRETGNFSDFIKRRIKYERNLNQLIGHFGDLAKAEISMPRHLLVKASLTTGLRNPIGLILAVPIVLWTKITARKVIVSSIWPIATSTKEI